MRAPKSPRFWCRVMRSTSGACSRLANASASERPEPARMVRNSPTLRARGSSFASVLRAVGVMPGDRIRYRKPPIFAARARSKKRRTRLFPMNQGALDIRLSKRVAHPNPDRARGIDHVVVGQLVEVVARADLRRGYQDFLLVEKVRDVAREVPGLVVHGGARVQHFIGGGLLQGGRSERRGQLHFHRGAVDAVQ